MTIDLALGGDEARWLYLPVPGRAIWSRAVGGGRRVVLLSLHASAGGQDLLHPGEVPVAAETDIAELLQTIAEVLGDDARIHELAVRMTDGSDVILRAHEERSLRLEAATDAAFVPLLERLWPLGLDRWRRILDGLRRQLLTESHLRLRPRDSTVEVEIHDRSPEPERAPDEIVVLDA